MNDTQFYPIHKGFVPGKNTAGCEKQPAMKFTDSYFTNLDDLTDSNNVLGLLNDEIVMIDTDTKEDTQALIRLLQANKLTVPYVQTTKGMHFYFRDASVQAAATAVMLCCGIVVDIKLGSRNGLDLIKMHGQFRDNGYFDAPLMPLPFWMTPIKDMNRCNLPTLANLAEGSRNAKLFEMIGRIKRAGLNYEQSTTTINLINNHVISKPLPKHEVNLLCRREGFDKSIGGIMQTKDANPTVTVYEDTVEELGSTAITPAPKQSNAPAEPAPRHNFNIQSEYAQDDDKAKFDPVPYAQDVIKCFNLKLIENNPHIYKNGVYVKINDLEFERIINNVMPNSLIRNRSEIKAKVMLLAPIVDTYETEADRKFISFNNGLFNIEDNTLVPHSPNYFVPNKIPHDILLEETPCPELDAFIEAVSCGSEDVKQQMYEMAGLCLYRRNFVRGCYILVGPKANGKSTFLNFLNYCLGRDNTTSMKLHQVSERFNTQLIDCKLANLGDDISDAYISDSSTLKSIITSDTMLVDVKNKTPYMMTPYATLIFSANTMPRATDATKALLDRMVIVPFDASFSAANGNLNTDMAATLHKPEVASEFLRRAIIALQRVRVTKTLTVGKTSSEIKREYEIENNSVLSFLTDPAGIGTNVDKEINRIPLVDVYAKYVDYCRVAGLTPMSRNLFTRNLKHQLTNATKKVINVNDKSCIAFVRTDDMVEIDLTF